MLFVLQSLGPGKIILNRHSHLKPNMLLQKVSENVKESEIERKIRRKVNHLVKFSEPIEKFRKDARPS